MNSQSIEIPNFKTVALKHIVLDYNGTIAKDGLLKSDVKCLLPQLCERYRVHVITADTFGSVHKQVADFDVTVKVLKSSDHTKEKADFIKTLDAKHCAAVGNGNNDALMLEAAAIGIALVGDEGCSTATLLKSDLFCQSIEDALELFIETKRLIATLRR